MDLLQHRTDRSTLRGDPVDVIVRDPSHACPRQRRRERDCDEDEEEKSQERGGRSIRYHRRNRGETYDDDVNASSS